MYSWLTFRAPSKAPWFSGKYTAKPKAAAISHGPTDEHQATRREGSWAAASRSRKYSAISDLSRCWALISTRFGALSLMMIHRRDRRGRGERPARARIRSRTHGTRES